MKPLFPVRLNRYFFTKLQVTANPTHNPGGNKIGSKVITKAAYFRAEESPSTFIAELSISVSLDDGDNPPYSIEVGVFGIAELDDKQSDLVPPPAIEATLAQVLYGAAREMVQILTARGPWGEFLLPLLVLPPRVEKDSPPETTKRRRTKVQKPERARGQRTRGLES